MRKIFENDYHATSIILAFVNHLDGSTLNNATSVFRIVLILNAIGDIIQKQHNLQ